MRPWQMVFPEFDRAVYAKAGFMARQPFGQRPGLLIIDVVESFTGTRREGVLDAIDEYRTSCGDQAWPALEAIQQLLAACRAAEFPVVYTKGDVVDKYFCGDSVKGTSPSNWFPIWASATEPVDIAAIPSAAMKTCRRVTRRR